MDTITQCLLGATTSEVGFRRRIGPTATWLATVSALIPDLDMTLAPFLDEGSVHLSHRGFSHSLLFSLLVPFALAALFRRFSRCKRYGLLWGCSFVAMLSHPLLDLCTTYGTRVFSPFSEARLAWNFIGIVDFVYTPILILTLVGCAMHRRWGNPKRTYLMGCLGLALSTAYIGLGAFNHHQAVQLATKRARDEGHTLIQVEAYPTIGTILPWRMVYETSDAFYTGRVNFLHRVPGSFLRLLKSENEWVDRAEQDPRVQAFREFTMEMERPIYEEQDGRPQVLFDDMRYAFPLDNPRSLWSVSVSFHSDGQIESVRFMNHSRFPSLPQFVRAIWHESFRR